ncbi:hypothetical protein AB0K80_21390 [Streptomyces sp. NPDC052682]|uniref:hypothetical protein n=1 Tax=Streptomyces sp. NPDC052682 TaxID=3154954 RepID=UPI00344108A0
MTTDSLREPSGGCETESAGGDGPGRRADTGRATTVPVIPLWERLRTGARG